MNDNFVSIKINGNKGEGPEIKKRLNVYGYPTVVFVDTAGQEIDRLSGWYEDRDSYFMTIKNYRQGIGTLRSLLAKVQQNPDDILLNNDIAMKYVSRWERSKARPYFEKVLKLDSRDTHGFAETATFWIAVSDVWDNENTRPLELYVKESSNEELLKQGFSTLIRFYEQRKEADKVIGIYENEISRFPENADILNGYAWFIYEERLTDKYQNGIEMAKKAVHLSPDAANIWDTLAWLYYEAGDREKAAEAMQKAVDLAPDVVDFKTSLEKIRQMPT